MKTSVKLRRQAASSALVSALSFIACAGLFPSAFWLVRADYAVAGWLCLAIGLYLLAIFLDRAIDAIGKAWRAGNEAKTENLRAVRPRI